MATISHEPRALVRGEPWYRSRDLWVSLAITAIWVAVALAAIFGSDLRTTDASGSSTTLPSGVAVAFFAVFATWLVARYGFERKER